MAQNFGQPLLHLKAASNKAGGANRWALKKNNLLLCSPFRYFTQNPLLLRLLYNKHLSK